MRTAVLRELDLRENTTTIEQEMTIKTLRQGWRMAEVPSHEHPAIARRLAYPRLARRAALRLFAHQVSVLCSALNILGIWDGHDSGAALLQDGRAAIRRQRRAPEPAQARDRISQPGRSTPASTHAGSARTRSTSSRQRPAIPRRRLAGCGRAARNGTTRCAGGRPRPGRWPG